MTRPWRSGADLRRPQRAHCPTAHTPTGGRTCVRRKQTLLATRHFLPHAQKWGVWHLDFWYGLIKENIHRDYVQQLAAAGSAVCPLQSRDWKISSNNHVTDCASHVTGRQW